MSSLANSNLARLLVFTSNLSKVPKGKDNCLKQFSSHTSKGTPKNLIQTILLPLVRPVDHGLTSSKISSSHFSEPSSNSATSPPSTSVNNTQLSPKYLILIE